jgi:Protein of unknown function (DUF4254)
MVFSTAGTIMSETLAALVDRLSIVNLKLWHCEEQIALADGDSSNSEGATRLLAKQKSLQDQRGELVRAIDRHLLAAVNDPASVKLLNPQNKIYAQARQNKP